MAEATASPSEWPALEVGPPQKDGGGERDNKSNGVGLAEADAGERLTADEDYFARRADEDLPVTLGEVVGADAPVS
nr:hypothetical protein [Micromonospora kangleipakensis]